MDVLVMGAGALGGYFGGRLAGTGHNVTFVARGAQLEALQKNGLTIESPAGDLRLSNVRAVSNPVEAPEADIVLFLVKNYDIEVSAKMLLPSLTSSSVIVTLQNGVSAPDRLRQIVGIEHVVPGIAFIPVDVKAPGIIRHSAQLQRLVLGTGTESNTSRVNKLIAALRGAGVEATVSDNVDHMLWRKFVFLSALSAMSTLTRLNIGPLRQVPETAALFRQAMNETEAVGRAVCPDLPQGVAKEQWDFMLGLPGGIHASMLDDLDRGKPLELNYLSGDVVRIGRLHGIATPLHEFVTAALQPYVNGSPC